MQSKADTYIINRRIISEDGRDTMLRYKEIKNTLAAEIAKLHGNDRLPSRAELCKKLETTRTTLDRAINELVAEGVLYSRGGSGTYVAGANEEISVYAGSWGVIVHDVRESFYADLVRGVENVAQGYGINVVLCNSDSDFDKQEQYIERLNRTVSGFVIAPVVSVDKQKNDRLHSQLIGLKIPFVFCNQLAEGINAPVVASNNFYGGYIATKHLLEKGYRDIAYIAYQKFRTSIDRYQGYISALIEKGIEINRKIIAIEDKSHSQPLGYEAMNNILSSGQTVDAVFCFNDKIARGVYQAINEAGLRVSDDIGVIGYDNTDICEKSTPAITSVTSNNLVVGTNAAKVLYKLTNKEDLSDFYYYLLQPDIIVRESCLGLRKE
jgi:DNA-binding LacI/PurR family transcriptional regulator